MADEIIRELWTVKDNIASEHNYDLNNLVKYLREKKRTGNNQIVDLRPVKKVAKSIAAENSNHFNR